jgi:Flp pilus assembly protein TadB
MTAFQRISARKRAQALIEADPRSFYVRENEEVLKQATEENSRVRVYLRQANLNCPPLVFIFLMLASALIVSFAATAFLSVWFTPLFLFAGAVLPVVYVERRISARAAQFASDYPTVLLATASSIKAGMTAYRALERATRLLPNDSLVRKEISDLLAALDKGVTREKAVSDFARSIRQADVELFRTAFLLASEHGGRFGPTLERLARVCRDRGTLTHMAGVRTATMRMTGNVLLALTPIIVMMIAVRTEGYWDLFLYNPTANTLSTIGILCILLSYATLIRMSNFRP